MNSLFVFRVIHLNTSDYFAGMERWFPKNHSGSNCFFSWQQSVKQFIPLVTMAPFRHPPWDRSCSKYLLFSAQGFRIKPTEHKMQRKTIFSTPDVFVRSRSACMLACERICGAFLFWTKHCMFVHTNTKQWRISTLHVIDRRHWKAIFPPSRSHLDCSLHLVRLLSNRFELISIYYINENADTKNSMNEISYFFRCVIISCKWGNDRHGERV